MRCRHPGEEGWRLHIDDVPQYYCNDTHIYTVHTYIFILSDISRYIRFSCLTCKSTTYLFQYHSSVRPAPTHHKSKYSRLILIMLMRRVYKLSSCTLLVQIHRAGAFQRLLGQLEGIYYQYQRWGARKVYQLLKPWAWSGVFYFSANARHSR